MRVLNVGGGGKGNGMPPAYKGWDSVWLDANPSCNPDLLMDATDLYNLEPAQFDAVYSAHCLEHMYPHELRAVVHGMYHVLTAEGFVDISVPNIGLLLKTVAERGLDLDSHLYDSPGGPIGVRDMIWGYSKYQALNHRPELQLHKNGFTKRTLAQLLIQCDFAHAYMVAKGWDLRVVGFKTEPNREWLQKLGLITDQPAKAE